MSEPFLQPSEEGKKYDNITAIQAAFDKPIPRFDARDYDGGVLVSEAVNGDVDHGLDGSGTVLTRDASWEVWNNVDKRVGYLWLPHDYNKVIKCSYEFDAGTDNKKPAFRAHTADRCGTAHGIPIYQLLLLGTVVGTAATYVVCARFAPVYAVSATVGFVLIMLGLLGFFYTFQFTQPPSKRYGTVLKRRRESGCTNNKNTGYHVMLWLTAVGFGAAALAWVYKSDMLLLNKAVAVIASFVFGLLIVGLIVRKSPTPFALPCSLSNPDEMEAVLSSDPSTDLDVKKKTMHRPPDALMFLTVGNRSEAVLKAESKVVAQQLIAKSTSSRDISKTKLLHIHKHTPQGMPTMFQYKLLSEY